MNSLINRLKARALGSQHTEAISISEFEQKIGVSFPVELLSLLNDIGDAVVFDRGAKFVPLEYSGREDTDGYLSIEVLYGGISGVNGLCDRYSMLKDQIPLGLIAIGEAPGGDQICLEQASLKVIFWKHDVEAGRSVTEIAKSITSFFESLEPDTESDTSVHREIVEGESFLDF